MVLIGVLIILLVAAVVIAVLLNGDGPATVGFDWFDIETSVTGVFLTGALCVLLTLLALWLMKVGLRRGSDRRAEMKGLRKKAEASEKQRHGEESSSSQSSRAAAPLSSRKATPSSSPQVPPLRSSSPKAPPPSSSNSAPSSASSSRPAREGPDEYFDTAPREK